MVLLLYALVLPQTMFCARFKKYCARLCSRRCKVAPVRTV
jgi:hypothetical protein